MDVNIGPTDIRIITKEELRDAKEKIKVMFNGNTLCDTVRQVYEIAETLGDVRRSAIQDRCLIIFCYAKRMDTKLVEYKRKELAHG